MKHYVLHLAADNDRNGNPRRCFVIFDEEGRTIETIDEGYEGDRAWIKKYPGARPLGRFATTPAQRRELLRA